MAGNRVYLCIILFLSSVFSCARVQGLQNAEEPAIATVNPDSLSLFLAGCSDLNKKDSVFYYKLLSCSRTQPRAEKYWKWYLTGRVYENNREHEAAILSFLKAEQYKRAVDNEDLVWLYFAFERIYNQTSAVFNSYDASKKALKYARKVSSSEDYGVALCDCICNATLLGKYSEARLYINEFDRVISKQEAFYPEFFRAKMIYYQFIGQRDSSVHNTLQYLHYSSDPDLLACAISGIKSEDYSLADSLLQCYSATVGSYEPESATYYMCRSKIEEWRGDLVSAYKDALVENQIINRDLKRFLISEPSVIAERYYQRIANMRAFVYTVIIISLVVFVALLLYIKNLSRRGKYKILAQQYERIKRAYENQCVAVLSRSGGLSGIEQEIIEMGESIGLSEDEDLLRVCTKLANLSGAAGFVKHLAMVAEINCGQFVSCLREKNLTPYEIGYCFLLILGFKTSELKNVLNRTNVYNRNVEIRNKLGVVDRNASLQQELMELYALSGQQ